MSQHETNEPHAATSNAGGRELTRADRTGGRGDSHSSEAPNTKRRARSKDEYLGGLDALAELVAIGLLTPTKANSMRSIYQTILAHLDPEVAPGAARQLGEADLQALREYPGLLRAFAPLLSADTINQLLKGFKDDPSAE